MKKFCFALVAFVGLTVPTLSHAYFGAKIGVVDEDNFGYGLVFGAGLPANLGLDFGLTGFYNKTGAGTTLTKYYWIQADLDLAYDFRPFLKEVFKKPELHPYMRGGFTYAGFLIDAAIATEYKASHGPGFNFGGGVDWKVLPWLSLGVDLSESIIYLNGVTVGGQQLTADTTAKVFSAMGVVKFFAYGKGESPSAEE